MSGRSNPFDELERMFERMSRQFDEMARGWEFGGEALPGPSGGRTGVDLADHGDEFVVTADVPGFDREDVDLRISNSTLHVHARREESAEEREENYLRSERSQRALSERVRLPEPVDEDAVSATLKNGVLTVTLPKVEPTEAREIDIE